MTLKLKRISFLIGVISCFSTVSYAQSWTELDEFNSSVADSLELYGYSTSIYDNIAVVGAPYLSLSETSTGAIFVYEKNSDGNWIFETMLFHSDSTGNDGLGSSVSVYGDRILAGAPRKSDSFTFQGAAYLFEKDASGAWVETEKFTASDAAENDYYGNAVSIWDDLIVIGAFGKGIFHTGAAYVFEETGGTWSETARIESDTPSELDYFGHSISIHEDIIVIGAYGDNEIIDMAGAAYVFEKSGTDWNISQQLIASDGETSDLFGYSVSIYNETIAIGARGESDMGENAGSVYIFDYDGGMWNQTEKLNATDASAQHAFGNSVALNQNLLIIGAPYADSIGAVYSFELSPSGWNQTEKITATDGSVNHTFGWSVSTQSGYLIVGAPSYNFTSSSQEAAYIFEAPFANLNENKSSNQTLVFPNPSFGEINIHTGSIDEATINIYTMDGHLIHTQSNVSPVLKVEISESPGIYFIEIDSQKHTERHKLIIK